MQTDNCTAYGLDKYNCGTYDRHASWFLLSACRAGGKAWKDVLCRSDGYASGVVNWYSRNTWRIFAHELGHNFGAGHTFEDGVRVTGGIYSIFFFLF